MFCIKCFYKSTSVINSRPQRKHPSVWRRRKCPKCQNIFTTRERPSLAENNIVTSANREAHSFNLGKLIISLSKAFSQNDPKASYDILWIAQNIEDQLSTEKEYITNEEIAAVAHKTLRHFDEVVALQYAIQHNLISSVRPRRGRPTIRQRNGA